MKKKWVIASVVFVVAALALVGPVMSNVEKPKYEVIKSFEDIEIRKYKPVIVAKVEVKGSREDSIKEGFRILADYIFGNNKQQSKISMTSPVEQQSKKIAMTAPVEQQMQEGSWVVWFNMPSDYNLENLPAPVDTRIKIEKVEANEFAVIQFTGSPSEENLASHLKALREFCYQENIITSGEPKFAFYNPPWTLPFMRRNEIMLLIED